MGDTSQRMIVFRLGDILKYLLIFSLVFVSASTLNAQNRTLKGVVVDVAGNLMPGVNVVNIKTNKGTITDIDGQFSIQVAQTGVVRFSFVGCKLWWWLVCGQFGWQG